MTLQFGIANRFEPNATAAAVVQYRESRPVVNAEVIVVNVELSTLALLVPSIVHTLVDHSFAGLATDADYQRDAAMLAAEFAQSDWEALLRAELDD